MPVKANEYWGRIGELMQPREPDIEPDFTPTARQQCAEQGHMWPDEDGQPCERCGKPSALPGPDHSSPPYVAERDALIPIAEATATAHIEEMQRRHGPFATLDDWSAEWTRKFHETMDVLVHALHHANSIGAPVHPRPPCD